MAKKSRKKSAAKAKKKRKSVVRKKSKTVAKRKVARKAKAKTKPAAKPKAKRKGVIAEIVGAAQAVVDTLTDAERLHHKMEPRVSREPE